MFALIHSEDGALNSLTCRSYYTLWAAQQEMWADFLHEYEDFYDTTEPPADEDNDHVYWYDADISGHGAIRCRAMLSLNDPDTPEWVIVEMED